MATFTPTVIRDRSLHNGYVVLARTVHTVGSRPDVPDAPMPAPPPLTQAEMVERIEAARREEAPPCCPTCGSTVPDIRVRQCYRCHEIKLLSAFSRHSGQPLGRGYICQPCAQADNRAYRLEKKRAQFRQILGRAG